MSRRLDMGLFLMATGSPKIGFISVCEGLDRERIGRKRVVRKADRLQEMFETVYER